MILIATQEVLEIHRLGIERWTGDPTYKPDTVDRIDGAIGAARTAACMQTETGEPDLLVYASGVLNYIGRAQYFVDGNKRAAWGGCVRALEVNGFTIQETTDKIIAFVLDMVEAKRGIQDVADWIGDRIVLVP